MQDPFDQKKQSILKEIQSDDLDLSPKGTIDELCLPIINLINGNEDMVTTSSCSGRVSIYLEGTKDQNKIVTKGNEGRWLFVTHEPSNLHNWSNKVDFNFSNISQSPPPKNSRSILYKFEPLILHVKCRNSTIANKLYQIAMNNGFRESGIGSNYNVAIRISIRLDIPIGYKSEDNDSLHCFVSKDYLDFIDTSSLERFEENTRKLNQLYRSIEQEFSEPPEKEIAKPNWESKEKRRQRMMEEGLRRQQKLKSQTNQNEIS